MSWYEDQVARKIQERAKHGVQKYGVSMERTDLTKVDWLRHAQEEAMDLAVYLERCIENQEHLQERARAAARDRLPPDDGGGS